MTPSRRFAILQRDGHRCVYCGTPSTETTLHIDHVVALAAGGTDDSTNCVTACRDCNLGKSSRPTVLPAHVTPTLPVRLGRRHPAPRPAPRAASVPLDLAAITAASRARQNLPPKVEDPGVLAKVAATLPTTRPELPPRTLRVDDLTTDQRRLVLALFAAEKAAKELRAASARQEVSA